MLHRGLDLAVNRQNQVTALLHHRDLSHPVGVQRHPGRHRLAGQQVVELLFNAKQALSFAVHEAQHIRGQLVLWISALQARPVDQPRQAGLPGNPGILAALHPLITLRPLLKLGQLVRRHKIGQRHVRRPILLGDRQGGIQIIVITRPVILWMV